MNDDDVDLSAFGRFCARLSETRAFRALEAASAAERQLGEDYELASLVEIHFGERIDPVSLHDHTRTHWRERLPLHESTPVADPWWKVFWLLDGPQRVGTLGCHGHRFDTPRLDLFSLYVRPEHRQRGHAARALIAAKEAAHDLGLFDVRLSTSWCVPDAARLYMRLGMWVTGWKRDISLSYRAGYPTWQVEFHGDQATFQVGEDRVPMIVAVRRGTRLEWNELPALHHDDNRAFCFYTAGTFALALALDGWPLIRTEERWQEQLRQGFSDVGGPEGLALKIRFFEAWARENGWRVTSPRIPGLDYPSHGELIRE
jgi:GNAT superfamily N-acetyltransferase